MVTSGNKLKIVEIFQDFKSELNNKGVLEVLKKNKELTGNHFKQAMKYESYTAEKLVSPVFPLLGVTKENS